MRILALGSANSGVSYHRVIMPLVYLAEAHKDLFVKITNHIDDEELEKGLDILVMNRSVQLPAVNMLAFKKKYGFKLVIDNDDYWELDPTHVLYEHYRVNNIAKQITDYIEIADICTVTHERLAYMVQSFNKNVHVIPNALPFGDGQFNDFKAPSEKIRLFWSGSDTHAQDISMLRYPMTRVYSDVSLRSKISTIMAGYDERSKPVWDVMVSAFTHSLQFESKIFKFTHPDRYMGGYTESDICLVPLVTSTFNSMKSNLKVLEAACKRNPVIVSETNPYLNIPVCYARTKQYWYKWVKELVNDESSRIYHGQLLYDWALQNHDLKTINKLRYELYSSVCNYIP